MNVTWSGGVATFLFHCQKTQPLVISHHIDLNGARECTLDTSTLLLCVCVWGMTIPSNKNMDKSKRKKRSIALN